MSLVLPVLPVLFGLSAPAAAAGEHGFLLGVGAGYLWVDPAENLESTWTVVPRPGYGVSKRWALEADVGLLQGTTRSWGYGYDALTPRINVLFNMSPDSRLEPFIAAGGGFFYKHVRRDPETWEEAPKDGENWGNYKNPDSDALVNLGYGMYLKLAGPVALRVDFRSVLNFGTEPHGDVPDSFANWEFTAGLCYRDAERRRDTDDDGIVDRLDGCPEDPEDYDRFEDDDGCPDDDNDEDGVYDDDDDCPDVEEDFDGWRDRDGCPEEDNDGDAIRDFDDACPDDAEDRDGYQDGDGCPELDNDGDGLADLDDDCPNHPEDHDGYADHDGCEDPDNDTDGIVDYKDACPDVAEVWNGFEDVDGCPDEAPPPPPEVERFTGVIHGINFEVDSDRITVGSYPVLDEAANVLVRYPDVRIEVQGHTDADGPDEYNLDLSARRALSVVEYLQRRGVGEGRLEWIGFGETRPLVDNDVPESKAVNRRVEFYVINDRAASGSP